LDRNLRAFGLEGFLANGQVLNSFSADGMTKARHWEQRSCRFALTSTFG